MKRSLIMILVALAIFTPLSKDINTYNEYLSKTLVLDNSIDTFNMETLYKVIC